MANAEKTINDNVLPYVTEVGAYDIIKNNQEDKDKLSAMKSKVTMVSARADFDEIYDKKFPDTEDTEAEGGATEDTVPADGADTTVTDPAKQTEAEVKSEADVTTPAETVTPAADPAPKATPKAAPKTKTTKTTKPADEISVEDKK